MRYFQGGYEVIHISMGYFQEGYEVIHILMGYFAYVMIILGLNIALLKTRFQCPHFSNLVNGVCCLVHGRNLWATMHVHEWIPNEWHTQPFSSQTRLVTWQAFTSVRSSPYKSSFLCFPKYMSPHDSSSITKSPYKVHMPPLLWWPPPPSISLLSTTHSLECFGDPLV